MGVPRLRLVAAGTLLGAGLVLGAGPASAPAPPSATRADPHAQREQGPPDTAPDLAAAFGPAASPPARPQVDPAPERISDPALRARVEQVLGRPDLAIAGRVAVSLVSPDGVPLLSSAAELPLLPASTEKLLTAAAALEALGADHRFTTDLAATAELGADGTLAGDLVLVGDGDPALSTPVYGSHVDPSRPRTPLDSLADQAVAAGVRHVAGGVLGDPTVFADEPSAPGWDDAYFRSGDAARVSGLTVDTGRVIRVVDGTLTASLADDPAAQAAAALYALLGERGVTFGGTAGATRTPPKAPVPLGSVSSPPLVDLLRHTVQHSDNHMADAIFRSVGVAAGDATWAGSAEAVTDALKPLSLDWSDATLADGSGLSRSNRLPTSLLSTLQAEMTDSDLGAQWQGLMAVAGESGTLHRRLVGTIAEHRFRGKTGSLHDVRALAGTVIGPDGEQYHLAVVANDLLPSALPVARALQDALVVAVAEVLYGCSQAPTPSTPSAPAASLSAPAQPAAAACLS